MLRLEHIQNYQIRYVTRYTRAREGRVLGPITYCTNASRLSSKAAFLVFVYVGRATPVSQLLTD